MCGVAGFVGTAALADREDLVTRMLGTFARRGPDGKGMEVWPEAVLGHRRLAIFDLSKAGRQPMLSPDRSVAVTFNGAIYNFRELRATLSERGYSFRTGTDTEVLVHGYREWGIEGLVARLRGMFAFGLWDDHRRSLFLVRDRLGVKPLAYAVVGGQLAFASTVGALRAAGLVGEIDEQAITDYLEFGFVTDNRAIYRGATKVPAASIVEWTDGTLSTRRYWSPPAPGSDTACSFADAVEETERLFLRAVERRLQADVSIGALLSGGVDSSLTCWAIARLAGHVTAYTVGTPGDPMDETANARATACRLGISHHVLELSAADDCPVDEFVAAYTEPFACSSALGMLRVSKAVSTSATVLITGDGGDDVFLGYPEHRHLWLAQGFSAVIPAAAAELWHARRHRVPAIGVVRRGASFLNYATGGLGAVIAAHDGLPTYQRCGLLGERLADASVPERATPWSLEAGRRVLTDFLAYDRQTRFVGEYLTKLDGATMHYSLEARSPFLDHELWEFAAGLPSGLRLRWGVSKAILREIVRRRIGAQVASRSKRGFGIPVQRWITGRWRPAVEELLRDSVLEADGWIRSGPALALLDRSARRGWAPQQLWYLFILEAWLRHQRRSAAEGQHPDRPRVFTAPPREARDRPLSTPVREADR